MDPKGELTSYLETKLITGLFARLHLYGFTITDEEEKCIGLPQPFLTDWQITYVFLGGRHQTPAEKYVLCFVHL